MEKIPLISSTKSILSEQMLDLSNAQNAFDDTIRKFNEITSSRHLKLNIIIRNQINDFKMDSSDDNPPQTCNNIF